MKPSLSVRNNAFDEHSSLFNIMGYGTIVVAFTALLSLVLIAMYEDRKTLNSEGWILHTLKVQTKLSEMLSALDDMETSQRGYILTDNEEYLEPFNSALPLINQEISELKNLIRDNPIQKDNLKTLVPLIDAKIEEMNETILLRRIKGFDASLVLIETNIGKQFMDKIRATFRKMHKEERMLLVIRQQSFGEFRFITQLSFASILLLIIVISLIIFYRLRLARQVDEALFESEKLYRQASRIANLGNWVYDEVADKLDYCSDELARIHGVSPDAFLGVVSNFENDINRAHPDDREAYRKVLKDSRRNITPYSFEYRIIRSDGEIRHIREISEPICDNTGKLIQTYGTIQDITNYKKSEEEIKTYAELFQKWRRTNFIGIIQSNAAGDIIYFNDTMLAMLGYSNQDLHDGILNWTSLTPPEFLHLDRTAMEEAAKKGFWTPFEKEYFHKDGRRIPIKIGGSKYREDPDEYIVFVIDLNEQKDAHNSVQAALEEVERASQVKSDFLAHMNHELRTPLNAIIGFSQMIMEEVYGSIGNDNYVNYVRDIHESGHHLLHLINDVLDISKIEAGKFPVEETDVDVDEILKYCVRMIQARYEVTPASILYEPAINLPHIRADEYLVKQIFLNLLSNAVKYSGNDDNINLSARLGDRNVLYIVVADTGVGIAKDDIHQVLEPFGQARFNSLQSHEGTGLGLSLSKKLLELHSGTLNLESELGKGTTVTVTFPSERIIRT